jgi:hypothetical protein
MKEKSLATTAPLVIVIKLFSSLPTMRLNKTYSVSEESLTP